MEFIFSRKTDQEKVLDTLLTDGNPNYIEGEPLEKIIRVYQSTDGTTKPAKLTKYIMQKAAKASRHVQSVKFLVLLHKLTHAVGSVAVNNFASQKFPSYKVQRNNGKERYSVLSHLAFIETYQMYIVRLIHNYEDFKVVFGAETDVETMLAQQNVTIFHLLSKIQNYLHHLLKFDQIFNVCLVQYGREIILKQAAHLILCDVSSLYSFANAHVREMMNQIYTLPTNEAIFLYELYYENVRLSRKIKGIMEFKLLLKDFQVPEPTDLTIPQNELKKLKLYVHSLKARAQIGMLKLDLKYNLNTQEADLTTPYHTDRDKVSPDRFSSSPEEASPDRNPPEKVLTDRFHTEAGKGLITVAPLMKSLTEIETQQQQTQDDADELSPKSRLSYGTTPSFKANARFSFSSNSLPLRLSTSAPRVTTEKIKEEPENPISPDSFRQRPGVLQVGLTGEKKEMPREDKTNEPPTPHLNFQFTHSNGNGNRIEAKVKENVYAILEVDSTPRNEQESGFIDVTTPRNSVFTKEAQLQA